MGKVKSFVDLSLILRMLTPCIITKLNNKLSEISSLLRSERLQPHLPMSILLMYSELVWRHRRDDALFSVYRK